MSNVQFICITETWLKPEIPTNAIDIDGFVCYRDDRTDRKGGGVCIFARKSCVKQWSVVNKPNNFEVLMLQFTVPFKVILCVMYIPPQITNDNDISDCIIDTIDQILICDPDYKLIICGDFNKFNVSDIVTNLSLNATVVDPTRNKAILDQIYTDIDHQVIHTEVLGALASSDHNIVKLILKHDATVNCKSCDVVFDLRSSNMQKVKSFLSNVSWYHMFLMNNIDDKCNEFYFIMNLALSLLPRKKVKKSLKDKAWITSTLKALINDRWSAFRDKDFNKYNHLKQKVKEEIIRCKQNWANKCLHDNKNVWNLLKNTNKPRPMNASMFHDGNSTNNKTVADCINNHLILNCQNINAVPSLNPQVPKLSINFSLEDILLQFQLLKSNKSGGCDNLSSKILKDLAYEIAAPICHIYNTILEKGKWPTAWKVGIIIPIPKSNPPSVKNIRPISLLPIVNKIFETLLLQRLKPFFTSAISTNQFGFVSSSSTEMTIISILDDATTLLDDKHVYAISLISYDLRKAFDCVDHSILCNKLSQIIPSNLFYLIRDYLQNRQQQVKLGDALSNKQAISSGVPQGGVLSPYLFNVFINDLTAPTGSTIYKYADDTTYLIPHYSRDIESDIRIVDHHISQWCLNNRMNLNKSKTQILTINKSRTQTMYHGEYNALKKSQMKILGVTINNRLRFDDHLAIVIRKCAQRMYVIRQLKSFTNKEHLRIIYLGLIHSIMLYASAAFVHLPSNLDHKLKKIQRRAHNVICFKGCICNIIPSPVDSRHKHAIKLFLAAENNTDHKLNSRIPNRLPHTNKFRQPQASSSRRLTSFIPQVSIMCNNL